jgi:hydroxymethylglutaryl-CoA reductase (NADPH)
MCLAPFDLYSARIALLLGLAALLGGAIMAYLAVKKSMQREWDEFPWYLRGGGALLYFQIKWSIAKPKEVAPWVLLEVLGMIVMITSGTLIETRKPPPFFGIGAPQQQAANRLPNDPNPQPADPNPQPKDVNPKPRDPHPRPKDLDPQPKFEKPPKVDAPPAPRVSGAATIDKALADLASTDIFTRQKATDYLAQTPGNEHRPAVAKYLATLAKDPGTPARREVIRLLAVWGTSNEVPLLVQLLNDEDIATRNAILKDIGKLKDARTAAPVVRCFVEFQTRFNATKAIKEMGPVAEKEMLTLLNNPDVNIQADAVRLLKEIGTQQSVPALQTLAQSNMFLVRIAAQEALKSIAARTMK